jgi:uncharacterized protein YecT (DUF1311 family)
MRTLTTVAAALAALLLALPAAAEPCADAKTPQELKTCTEIDARNAEATLNEVREKIYGKLQSADLGEQTAAFEQAREDFTRYVNSHCKALALQAGDESTVPVLYEGCRARAFRARSVELEAAYEELLSGS